MRGLLIAACLVLSFIVCVPAAAQCAGGSCSVNRSTIRQAIAQRRTQQPIRGLFRGIFRRR